MTNVTFLDEWYTRLTRWYLSRPWYIRILCIGLVILIVALFLLRFIARGTPEEYKPDVVTDIPLDPSTVLDDNEETNAERTLGLKKQLLEQMKDREKDKDKYAQQASEITDATTMEELHALRDKFNL